VYFSIFATSVKLLSHISYVFQDDIFC